MNKEINSFPISKGSQWREALVAYIYTSSNQELTSLLTNIDQEIINKELEMLRKLPATWAVSVCNDRLCK